MEENNKLEKLNRFTRREHTADEVYIFDVVLCDNEVDRDGERFSVEALKKLKELFVGKTGISDHEAKSSGPSLSATAQRKPLPEKPTHTLKPALIWLKQEPILILSVKLTEE